MFVRPLHLLTRSRCPRAGMDPLAWPAGLRSFRHARHRSLLGQALGVSSLIVGACLAPALQAQPATFDGTVAVGSQLVDRGQVLVADTPVVQGAVSWTFPAGETASAGWSLGLSGSTRARAPGRLAEALAQATRYWPLSDAWQMQAGVLYYKYPGRGHSRAFDRAETGVSWSYRDVLTMGLSAIYVIGAHGRQPRVAADLNAHWPMADHFYISAGAGIAQSLMASYSSYRHEYASYGGYARERPYAPDSGLYGYGHVGLLWGNGPWRVELDRMLAGPKTRREWNALGAPPWVATISRSL